MTVRPSEVAELPSTSPSGPVVVFVPDPRGRGKGTPGSSDRRALRARRRRVRRVRRLYAAGGLAVLAAFLFATVAVLDVVR
jgi:hypothetical protein